MSMISILAKPLTPYRYLYLTGCILYSIILHLLVIGWLPPIDLLTLVGGSTFIIALVGALLMSAQPIEWVFDFSLRIREGTKYEPKEWPRRHRVAKYLTLQKDREASFNNLNLSLGTLCLIPGLWLSALVWPHPIMGLLPLFALILTILFAIVVVMRFRRYMRHLKLAHILFLYLPTFDQNVQNELFVAMNSQDWDRLEDINRERGYSRRPPRRP